MTAPAMRYDVLFRCDAGHAIGLGHLKRCMTIAAELRDGHGLDCALAGRFDDAALDVARHAEFDMLAMPDGPEADWLEGLLKIHRPQVLVCDIRTDLSPRELLRMKRQLALLITLDDASDRRLVSDIALLPPTAEALDLAWPDFKGEALIGWAWVVVATPRVTRITERAVREPPYQVLVTMGGADPFDLTTRVARNLRVFAENIMPHFIIGPAFKEPERTIAALRGMWPCGRVYQDLPDLCEPMQDADLAICAYGVTAQELAAAGVPTLYLAISDDHARSAEALAATGAGQNLGRHDLLRDEDMRTHVSRVLRNAQVRERMGLAGPKAIDGRGAGRIAERIIRVMKARAA